MKKLSLIACALFIIGCGGSSSSSSTSINEVDVQRGPVLNAYVVDANAQVGIEIGDGKYKFEKTPKYPIKAIGGIIDVNRNGIIDEGDVNNTLEYETIDGKSVTIVSTIGKNAEIREMLKKEFKLSDEEIFNALPDENKIVAAVSDEVYAYCVKHNIKNPANLTSSEFSSLKDNIKKRIKDYENVKNRVAIERQLIKHLGIKELNKTEAEKIRYTGVHIDEKHLINIKDKNLTLEEKRALQYMWNDEKLAHDLYLALYEIFPNKVLYTIATKSESRHKESVENLIKQYDLNITSSDFIGHYSASELASFKMGEFILPEISELYTKLYALGAQSEIDALKVGCMVEVTDIRDLDKYIPVVNKNIALVFGYLKEGSYHHYKAFDKSLKSLGVSDGCCSMKDYCLEFVDSSNHHGDEGHGKEKH